MRLKLLAVGNSFSNNAVHYLPQIVADFKDCELVLRNAWIGGCSLEKHVRLARINESEPANKEGRYYDINGHRFGLKELLLQDEWDVVTIQQVSNDSFKVESYRPCAKELVDFIKKYRPKAEIAIHETWAYRSDNANTFKDGFTATAMYQGIVKSYHEIAKELGIGKIIPSGDAFQLVCETPSQAFEKDASFDAAKAVKPQLPKQSPSLHVGWFWGEDGVLRYDHGHANARGEFLGACVWFETLFGKDVRKGKFAPESVSAKDAKFLRGIAHKAVSEGVKPKAWPL